MTLLEDLRIQLYNSLSDPEIVFICCDSRFDTLYEFRQHVFEHHRDIYDVYLLIFTERFRSQLLHHVVPRENVQVISLKVKGLDKNPHCPLIRQIVRQ